MPPELRKLLTTAFKLLEAGESAPLETITIADKQFRVIAERHEEEGWLLVLIAEPDRVACGYKLMTQYRLTERQLEVARLLGERYSDKEIAEALGVTLATAERHSQNVMKKLGVSGRKAVRAKLLDCCSNA